MGIEEKLFEEHIESIASKQRTAGGQRKHSIDILLRKDKKTGKYTVPWVRNAHRHFMAGIETQRGAVTGRIA